MAYAGVKDDFIACTRGEKPTRIPLFSLSNEFHQCQAGLTAEEARLDVDEAVACQADAVRKYDEDWAIIFPDDYVEFEPLGLKMRDDKEHPAMPVSYLPFDRETLHKFKIPDAAREMRIPLHLEMLRRLKHEFGDNVMVMGRIAAPFTSLALVYGIEKLMLATITNPDLVVDNVKFFIDHQTAFGKAQLAAGANLIWLGDCCASSMFCSLDCCRKYAFAAAAEVAASLTACGGLVIYHSGDASLTYLAEQVQLPVNAVNVGEGCSLTDVRERVGREMCLMGNFDPILLRDGSPAEISGAAARMVRENLRGGRYLFNTGESVMCNSPAANVSAMLNAVRKVSLETVHDTDKKFTAVVR